MRILMSLRDIPNDLRPYFEPANLNGLSDTWKIPTQPYKESHFATFPERIPEIAIRAGTSERGCCPKCGAPWARITESTKRPRGDSFGKKDVHEFDHGQAGSVYVETIEVKTLGWKPTCYCDVGEPVPCIVLDPFAGSGTTGEVAYKLGRRFVMIDLAYQEHQRKRIPPMALIAGAAH